jgi:hypothetical protein
MQIASSQIQHRLGRVDLRRAQRRRTNAAIRLVNFLRDASSATGSSGYREPASFDETNRTRQAGLISLRIGTIDSL